VVIAVTAGSLLRALPDRAVAIGAAVLFLVGAVLLWRDRSTVREEEESAEGGTAASVVTARRAVLLSAGTVLVAEWGDLTQLATASLAARLDQPVGVGIGALLGLWAVAAIAAVAGKTIERRLPVITVRRAAAVVFFALACLAVVDAVRA
jgi:putative Ca2+/H+ antiporter (TMEM165/GDT1 family)